MRYVLSENAELVWVDDEMCLFNERGDVAIVNKIGGCMVSLLLRGGTVSEAADNLGEKYGVSAGFMEKELLTLINELVEGAFLCTMT